MIDKIQSGYGHVPVLLKESIDCLSCDQGGTFIDCTFGGGGHTTEILKSNLSNVVYSIDCDVDAAERAQNLKNSFANRFYFFNTNFSEINSLNISNVDGILMDLGVSSFQLDEAERGFSFKFHAPLDMRMDKRSELTAENFLNTASEYEIIHAIKNYGEEPYWQRIVNIVFQNRHTDNLKFTDNFAKIIKTSLPITKSKIHPATKTFQGIRIAINKELAILEQTLPLAFKMLKIGGRMVIISFHSLEDRIVKQFFKKLAGKAINKNDNTPEQEKIVFAKIITNKPIIPRDDEIINNSRSRSAKMRVIERVY